MPKVTVKLTDINDSKHRTVTNHRKLWQLKCGMHEHLTSYLHVVLFNKYSCGKLTVNHK